jgi:hypothetical protein
MPSGYFRFRGIAVMAALAAGSAGWQLTHVGHRQPNFAVAQRRRRSLMC